MTTVKKLSGLYMHLVLTVIALCLSIIVLRDIPFFPEVRASDNPDAQLKANSYGLVPLNEDGSVNVRIVDIDNVIEVDIKKISTYDEMPVNIEELNGSSIYNALPVEVRD